MNAKSVQTLVVLLDKEISLKEIPYFRGCVVHSMEDANILFHNHWGDEQLRYRYPLIQYKRIGGKAAIVCVEFFSQTDFHFMVGERVVDMEIDHIDAKRTILQVWDSDFRYTLRKWLPLSSENYREYSQLEGISERCDFLQRILVGNILSFCKGVDVTIESEIKCVITDIMDTHSYLYKGVKMQGFDVEFKTNISLPDYVGLGKGVSLGFGMVKSENKNNKT